MTHELETLAVHQMEHVGLSACEKIVQANDFVAFVQKSLTQMRADKSGSAGNENPHILQSLSPNCRAKATASL
jgi:hypothetical protein